MPTLQDLDASAQLNPYFDGGAVSLFTLRNPIYNYSGGAGAGLRHVFNDNLDLNLGYLSPGNNASKPLPKDGLFNGVYAALAQIIISPSDNSKIGLTYINSYSPSFFTTGEGLDAALNPDFIPLSDNIQITPGIIWLTAPNHDEKNNDAVIGVIRTVYRF